MRSRHSTVLISLLDKSLVRRSGERVWMLETIREFASEQLSASPAADDLRDRHAGYYLALAESSDSELHGPGQAEALRRLASEREDLRVAFGGCSSAIRLRHFGSSRRCGLSGLHRRARHFREGPELLAAALERALETDGGQGVGLRRERGCWPGSRVTTGSREERWRRSRRRAGRRLGLVWRRTRSAWSRSTTRPAGTNRSA